MKFVFCNLYLLKKVDEWSMLSSIVGFLIKVHKNIQAKFNTDNPKCYLFDVFII